LRISTARSQWSPAEPEALGEPGRDLVILAEGNTSIHTAPDRMLVKASGSQLGAAVGEDFIEVGIRTMLVPA
jgi:hypothetical protein